MAESICLCIDVGGTKLDYRFIRFDGGGGGGGGAVIVNKGRLLCAEFPSFNRALKSVMGQVQDTVDSVCIAAAGPMQDGRICFTNLDWVVDSSELSALFGFKRCIVINDLTAVTWSLQELSSGDYVEIKSGFPQEAGVQLVVAPGTGLGVGFAIAGPSGITCMGSEGGHVSYSPRTAIERQLLAFLSHGEQPVSAEAVCSGLGLGNLFRFLTREDPCPSSDLPYTALGPWLQEQVAGDLHYKAMALATYELFFDHLAEVCGNLAVTCLPTGGIYLAGGLMAKLVPFMDQQRFIARFRHRSVQKTLLDEIPISLLLHTNPALVGCEKMIRDQSR